MTLDKFKTLIKQGVKCYLYDLRVIERIDPKKGKNEFDYYYLVEWTDVDGRISQTRIENLSRRTAHHVISGIEWSRERY